MDAAAATAAAAPGSAEIRDDPGKVTYNLLLKNELLGAGVNNMKVSTAISLAICVLRHDMPKCVALLLYALELRK